MQKGRVRAFFCLILALFQNLRSLASPAARFPAQAGIILQLSAYVFPVDKINTVCLLAPLFLGIRFMFQCSDVVGARRAAAPGDHFPMLLICCVSSEEPAHVEWITADVEKCGFVLTRGGGNWKTRHHHDSPISRSGTF